MKKKIRRLRLDRETLRTLTPEHLERAAGGWDPTSRWASCDRDTVPASVCLSCHNQPTICC